jgi:hypothetical protein
VLPRLLLLLVACVPALADDVRQVASPNGQLEFQLFTTPPEPGDWTRLAYRVFRNGKLIMDTAFLGFDIVDQEPLLGENVGLIGSANTTSQGHNSLVARYMQNGSLGRLLTVEVRAYDDGIAFRYVIPFSPPLAEILIADEATEFQVSDGKSVTEVRDTDYPAMRLEPLDATHLVTRLASKPFTAKPPLTTPWRVIVIGKESAFLRDLLR